MQESCKNLARRNIVLQESCKNLARSCKINFFFRLGKTPRSTLTVIREIELIRIFPFCQASECPLPRFDKRACLNYLCFRLYLLVGTITIAKVETHFRLKFYEFRNVSAIEQKYFYMRVGFITTKLFY